VPSPARNLAFDVLLAVAEGGYASDLLASRSIGLDTRDAGLASEIVLGPLRFQAQLDYLIELFSGRPAARLDTEVRIALRMGIYQTRYLERVPAHAAVDESVELVKRARKRSAAGFVNAVLRKVDRREVAWPDRAVALSHPEWMLARWDRQFGHDAAEAVARANLRPPETYIRVPGQPPPGAEPTGIPGCYRLTAGNAAGFRVQDIGSQSIVPLLRLEPGPALAPLTIADTRAVDRVHRGLAIASFGFPAASTDPAKPRGRVAVDVVGDVRGDYVQTGLAIAPGTSGSPVFDDAGLVVAIVAGGDFVADPSGRVAPSGSAANWAISVSVLRELLGQRR